MKPQGENPNECMLDALLGVAVVTSRSHAVDSPSRPISTQHLLPTETGGQRLNHRTISAISYAVRGQTTLPSFWDDPRYFTVAFSSLSPEAAGGHLDQRPRPIPVPRAGFAGWSFRHHSRRQVTSANNVKSLPASAGSLVVKPPCTCYMMCFNTGVLHWE